jgi:hypothetical protein
MEARVSALLRDLLGVLGFVAAVRNGGGNTGEVQSLIFQDENPRSRLN